MLNFLSHDVIAVFVLLDHFELESSAAASSLTTEQMQRQKAPEQSELLRNCHQFFLTEVQDVVL